MKTKIMEHLLNRLGSIFGKPRNAEHIAEELAKVADPGLTEADLDELAANIIVSRKAKGFPSPSELITLIKAVPQMKGRGGGSSNPERTGLFDPLIKTGPNKSAHEIRTNESAYRIGGRTRHFGYGGEADNLRYEALDEAERRALSFLWGTEIAARAIAERWAVGLLEFCIREGREPGYEEERDIVALVRRNDIDVRDFVSKPPQIKPREGVPFMPKPGEDLGPGLRKMRAEMHARAEKLLSEAPRPGAGHSSGERG